MKNGALNNAQLHLEQEHKKVATLLKRIESLDFMDQRVILLVKELENHKTMLSESSKCQLRLKQQMLNCAWNLTSTAESLKNCLGENEYTCRQMETSLVVQVENEVTLEQEKECILSIDKKVQENPNLSMVTEQATIQKEKHWKHW
ncbi:hypothetical protein EZV62_019276 [Acer yangbiense]|uniref:Uncharacterized protein n=1 Tax=Acer yangbiense TaxID=1000413 RepID=A0A5C7HAJ6_9ROSI|nr:hypothetical protein EZV62_019276 [Acer yangbiense]